MRVRFSIVGTVERHAPVSTEMDAIPAAGDTVHLPGVSEANTVVRTVVWYPLGDDESQPDGNGEPFVYIVLGLRRV